LKKGKGKKCQFILYISFVTLFPSRREVRYPRC